MKSKLGEMKGEKRKIIRCKKGAGEEKGGRVSEHQEGRMGEVRWRLHGPRGDEGSRGGIRETRGQLSHLETDTLTNIS